METICQVPQHIRPPAFDKKGTYITSTFFKKLKQSQPVKSLVLVEGYGCYKLASRRHKEHYGAYGDKPYHRAMQDNQAIYGLGVCFDGDSAGRVPRLEFGLIKRARA